MYDRRISIVTPGTTTDGYSGVTVPDWATATVTEVPFGVEVQPRMTTEDTDDGRRVFIQVGWRVISPPGHVIPLGDLDRIRVEGMADDLDVVGNPGTWEHTSMRHSEIDVEVARG
ncbi:hypothetical protein ACFORJ_06140 [Corynebacterium hansenii]|uniref:Head-to-tail stopper n=2 Tax=root TaxID=1 RepID=A0A514DJC9_9CAUD|nr:hypothetical protein [Corynebacterium hansenii]YP_009847955.1 head-to-tail stopper [Corynebacterium phage StAB]QDH93720.1 head-to-tail stopper [Corynebacterium phage StAB]WJZ00326.1 hypothetical protein CHAN_08585 [Corynebacterium hansenii]